MSDFASQSSHSLTASEIGRYSRQLIVEELGVKGQERLRDASVLIVGAGGLGCPVAMYLAAAGVGKLGVVDHDDVSIDNLHRQVLHSESSVDTPKAHSIQTALNRLNSSVTVVPYCMQLTSKNALNIIKDYDIVADCSDNAATRYLVNDACVLTGKPLVSGSALRWEGQLTVYHNGKDCPCYRCIYPEPPRPDMVTNCADGGVIGPVVGVIGSMQALEIIKVVTGVGSSFAGNLFLFDGLMGRTRSIKLRSRREDCLVCGHQPTVTELIDYELMCGSGACDKIRPLKLLAPSERMLATEYAEKRRQGSHIGTALLDTRPVGEFAFCHLPEAINIPLEEMRTLDWAQIAARLPEQSAAQSLTQVVAVCHRGNDSQLAVQLLREKLAAAAVSSASLSVVDLVGGLEAWAAEVDAAFPRY
uniref:Adenylyltransferase and sulfurtransferase MOCS3 homolog n=1 Tax=Plectus sambesii TaxID=2011161 RepID=A0A914VIB8_9BILA